MRNTKTQSIHEEACLQISSALAKITYRRAIVDIVNPNLKKLEEFCPTVGLKEEGAGVSLPFGGSIKGIALLLFSRDTAFNLADLLIKRQVGATGELTELGKSALEELGNIICGTYLATFSSRTGTKIVQHAPQFSFGMLGSILEQTITKFTQRPEKVLAIETEFNFTVPILKDYFFRSYFVVLFETKQLEEVLDSSQQKAAKRDSIEETVVEKI